MPNIKSAKKRVLVIEKKTERNNMIKSGYKSAVKKFEQSLENNNAEETKELILIVRLLEDRNFEMSFGIK